MPHICDEIQDWIARVASISTDGSGEPPDICVIELGGTIGDIESMPFVEVHSLVFHDPMNQCGNFTVYRLCVNFSSVWAKKISVSCMCLWCQ